MVDVTPMIAPDRKVIQSYGTGGFKVSGEDFTGSLLVFPGLVTSWTVPEKPEELEAAHFAQIIGAEDVDVVLFGGGNKAVFLSIDTRNFLKEYGIIVESMDTGAACRTYNVLLAEERNIVAAIYQITE